MCKTTHSLVILAAMFVPLLYAAPAAAAPPSKVWVANNGANSPSCGAVGSPCLTFSQAHDNVAAGGEISVLTPGDYGAVSIGKSVNITNEDRKSTRLNSSH